MKGRMVIEREEMLANAAMDLAEALIQALDAMERNIAYATRKDEPALAAAIPAARAALRKAERRLTSQGLPVNVEQ